VLDIGSGSLLDVLSTDWMDATRLDATRRISIAASNSGGNAFDRSHVHRVRHLDRDRRSSVLTKNISSRRSFRNLHINRRSPGVPARRNPMEEGLTARRSPRGNAVEAKSQGTRQGRSGVR
jgi:hypothetical protein